MCLTPVCTQLWLQKCIRNLDDSVGMIHIQMDEIHEAVAAHLLYEGPVQIVWAPNAQVQNVHLCSDCIVERIQKPAGVRHLHTMREHQLKPALEPEYKQPPENASTSNQYSVAETKIIKILVCMLMSPMQRESAKQVESKDVQAADMFSFARSTFFTPSNVGFTPSLIARSQNNFCSFFRIGKLVPTQGFPFHFSTATHQTYSS